MYKITLLSVLIFLSFNTFPQGFITAKNIKVDLSGFVRNDFIFDARRNLDASDQLLEIYPLKPVYDVKGEDINSQPSAKLMNTFSRLGTTFSGLEMGKSKISALIEIDFTGGIQTPTLRLRHAYTLINWPKSKLLVGRTWHPAFIEKVFPMVLNENTGLPFQVFNRSPQVRFTYNLSSNFDFIAAAVYQFDYSNTGPSGKTYHYQRDAVVPNMHGQIQYYNQNWVLGAGVDWKSVQPRTSTTGASGTFVAKEKLNTWAALAYLKYSKEKFVVMAKSMYGQNVCENLLPSGYAVASLNPLTGAETYTPLNHVYNWINAVYGKTWQVGMYVGYLKNMGTSENPIGPFYGMSGSSEIDNIYKISPQLIYNFKNFMFGCEFSWTTAGYGQTDLKNKGKVVNVENVTNFRNMISIAYKF
ncbi:MAG: hypothetical protein FD181_2456 [Prolixibacteraceae bacterium]|nr:MAG: hypothetical protein FD181_2456 [Prolixibacteraceae bacterium]